MAGESHKGANTNREKNSRIKLRTSVGNPTKYHSASKTNPLMEPPPWLAKLKLNSK